MSAQECQMLSYLRLALLSQKKRQQSGRDKFLVLTAVSACREGLLEVAERCREIVLGDSPTHILSKADDFASFLKNEEFAPFLRKLERFCSFEQAEYLLDNLGIDPNRPADVSESDIGDYAMQLLHDPDWDEMESRNC